VAFQTGSGANRRLFVALAVALVGLTGCDLLDVTDPDVIAPGDLETPAGREARRLGALGDFYRTHAGRRPVVTVGGGMADEWESTDFNAAPTAVDLRALGDGNGLSDDLFLQLQRARTALEETAQLLADADPADPGSGQMLAFAGYTYLFLGETFCSGIPFSTFTPGEPPDLGVPETTTQVFQRGLASFERALAGAIDEQHADLARVGLGRVLLDLGDWDGARGTVAPVPTSFVRYTEYTDRQLEFTRNGIFDRTVEFPIWSVADQQGSNGLFYRSAMDPRVPWIEAQSPFIPGLTYFQQLTYDAADDPVPLATGIEARLIEAEAALVGGDAGEMVAILQALRDYGTNVLGLDFSQIDLAFSLPIADQGSVDGNVDLLFQERGFWLFTTGQRLGDLRRLIRQYGRDPESVFPTGVSPLGPFGPDVNVPVSRTETNNPEFTGCLDRDA
jgi:hypothetical protein